MSAPARPTDDLPGLRRFLYNHLMDSVLPFWTTHAIDPNGGINTCIANDGTVINRDKWLWSQWRAVWVFSKLYNCIERRSEWLDLAQHICRFAAQHGWDERYKGWVLRLSGDGEVLDGCDSIYVDGFAIYGLTELARATGSDEPLTLARRTADAMLVHLQRPHDRIPHFPYPVTPGTRMHGIGMINSLVLWELGQLADEQRYRDAALAMSSDIFDHFYRPGRDVVLERIAVDNTEYPPPLGTAVVPGHVIEDMWFQIHIARDRNDTDRIARACRLIRRHLELGWDDQHGGILLAVDADGHDEVGWKFADTKLWWPHTEALYALLLAYEHCREPWCCDWYNRVHEYSFSHYPDAAHGEWIQKLDRTGQPITETVALPVKDPFHLPRCLIYCLDVLDRLIPNDQDP